MIQENCRLEVVAEHDASNQRSSMINLIYCSINCIFEPVLIFVFRKVVVTGAAGWYPCFYWYESAIQLNCDEMKLSLINSVPVTSTYWPSLDVPIVTCQQQNLSKFNLGSLCLWFYETLMYIKLREFRAQLNPFGEVTNTSISEAFKCSRPQAFNLEDQVCSENQAWSIDVSAPVWECRRLLPNLLRQRTRKQRESNDRSSFKFGSWENEVADSNSSIWIFSEERYLVKHSETVQSRKKRSKTEPRPRKVTKTIFDCI